MKTTFAAALYLACGLAASADVDLALVPPYTSLVEERPEAGRIHIPLTVVNLGSETADRNEVELRAGGEVVARESIKSLKPREEVRFQVPITWDGLADRVTLRLATPDSNPANDEATVVLRRASTASLLLRLPAGIGATGFSLRDTETGRLALTAPGTEDPVSPPAGRYEVVLASRALTPFDVDLADDNETVLDLASTAGTVRIVPFPDLPFPEFDVYSGDRQLASAASWGVAPAESYLLAPGEYRLGFHHTYLSDIDVQVEAGKETVIDLADRLGRFRLTRAARPVEDAFEILDAQGGRLRELAPWGSPLAAVYGLSPGHYQLRFREGFATPVEFDIRAGETTSLELDEHFGYLKATIPLAAEPVTVFDAEGRPVAVLAGWAESPSRRLGLRPGSYTLSSERIESSVAFEIEAGKESQARVTLLEEEGGPGR